MRDRHAYESKNEKAIGSSLRVTNKQRRSRLRRHDGSGNTPPWQWHALARLLTGRAGAPVPFVICPKGWIPALQKL
jgi:hypothetical protein